MNRYGKALACTAAIGTGICLILRGVYSAKLDARFRELGYKPPEDTTLSLSDRREILDICRRQRATEVSANL